jgi:4-hydroxybutyryl-CoA dehydratase/vinylacetyl-CoA-Delta-isomerase
MEFLKYMQKNDLTANAGVTDVEGRTVSLLPYQQVDKDMFIHVVEKRATA